MTKKFYRIFFYKKNCSRKIQIEKEKKKDTEGKNIH